MSAARAVLSGPNSLSNNSALTCASTCGQAPRAAPNNSSSTANGDPPGPCLVPISTHSPYGSGLSIGSIGFISQRPQKACHWVAGYVNGTRHNYVYLKDFFLL